MNQLLLIEIIFQLWLLFVFDCYSVVKQFMIIIIDIIWKLNLHLLVTHIVLKILHSFFEINYFSLLLKVVIYIIILLIKATFI